MSASGTAITFTAADAESNAIVVTRDGAGIRIRDTGTTPVTTATPATCSQDGATAVLCSYGPPAEVTLTAELGDANDKITTSGVANLTSTLRGGPGADDLQGGPAADTLDGGANQVDVPIAGTGTTAAPDRGDLADYGDRTGSLSVTLDGVANEPDGDVLVGIEDVTGGSGADVLIGDGGPNELAGGAGNDTLTGGGGADDLRGDAGGAAGGDDVLNGEDGDDLLLGGAGADQLNGGGADDRLAGAGFPTGDAAEEKRDGDDRYNGGEGTDIAAVRQEYIEAGKPVAVPVRITLDEQADDGPAGQNDLVGADVEDVQTGAGNDTVTASASFNRIDTGPGDDVVDPGAGSDFVEAGDRNDVISARDGYADDVDCGPGTDKATVDQLDRVRANCEQVDRAAVPSALEDKQPTVTFTGPISGAKVDAGEGIRVTADASDDKGVKEVRLLDDGKQVGVDAAAPYEFTYQPTGGDVGRNTLIAVAIDEGDQSGSDIRGVRVTKFKPATKPTFLVTPKRDRRAPFTYRFAGKIALPAGVTRRQGCRGGTMQAQTKSRAGKTYSSRKVKIRSNCSWGLTVTFRSKERLGNGRLKARVVFSGNAVMGSFTTGYKALRAG